MVRSAVDNPAGKEGNESSRHDTAQKKNEVVVDDESEAAQSNCTRTPRLEAKTEDGQQPGPSYVTSHGPQRTVFKKASEEILIEEVSASSSSEIETLEATVIVEEPDDDTHPATPGSSEGEELVITSVQEEELCFEGTDETELSSSTTVVIDSSDEGIEPVVTNPRNGKSEQNDLASLECKTVKPIYNIPIPPEGSREEKVEGDINESSKHETTSPSAQNDLASLDCKIVKPNHKIPPFEETILLETDETVLNLPTEILDANLYGKPRLEEDWYLQEADIFSPVANSTIIHPLPKEKRLKIQICPNCEVFHKDAVCQRIEQDISKWKNDAFIAVNETGSELGSLYPECGSGDYSSYLCTLGSPLRNELNMEVITTPSPDGDGEAGYTGRPPPYEPRNENTFHLSAALVEPNSAVGITLTPEEVRVVKEIQDKKQPELKARVILKNTWLGRILKITLIAGCGWAAFKLARAFLSRRK